MHRSLPTALLATGLALAVCPSTYGQGLFGARSDGNSSTFSFRVPGATKEPDPALFKVPDGYRIVDETGPFTITIPGPAK